MTVQDLIQQLLDGIRAGALTPNTLVLVPDVWVQLSEDPRFVYRDLTPAEIEGLDDGFKPAELEVNPTPVRLDPAYRVTGGTVYRVADEGDPAGVPAVVLY